MKNKKRELTLIFTRDFTQWLNQMLRDSYVYILPKIWGKGLEDQVVRYTGRTTELYRYADDYKRLSEFMTRKPINSSIFDPKACVKFRKEVAYFRKLIALDPKKINDNLLHYNKITEAAFTLYPHYTLSVFLPGQWREQYIKNYGREGEATIERIFKSRKISEGILKLCSDYLCRWIGGMLEKKGLPKKFANLLSIEEMRDFLAAGKLPNKSILKARATGFVYIGGTIVPVKNFDLFLFRRRLAIKNGKFKFSRQLKGVVASPGELIKGTTQVIFNSDEVSTFRKGLILVTPMTQPEYLSAMKKAKAIITDEGGITCHAAIVSRELGIPCVIGTKIATKVLKDGDIVEVDANKGIVKIIK